MGEANRKFDNAVSMVLVAGFAQDTTSLVNNVGHALGRKVHRWEVQNALRRIRPVQLDLERMGQ